MKIKLAAAAILLASTSIGSAADLAVKAPYAAPAPVWSWTGFYIGAHAGAGWGTSETSLTSISGGGIGVPVGLAISQVSRSGFLGGGQVGYDYQTGWAVLGIQGDIAGLDVSGTAPCVVFATCTAKSDWLATVTGRVGAVVADRGLIYVKGGAAWLHTTNTMDLSALGGGAPVGTLSSDLTSLGGLLGMGVEYAFAPNWSAFLEYDYISFEKKTVTSDLSALVGAPASVTTDRTNKLSVAKIGVNYKFH